MDFPVNLRLFGRPCLVVGGGTVARRKARALARAGARVTVVAPEVRFRGCHVLLRRFRASDVDGTFAVIAATGDAGVNRRVHAACLRRGVPVNVVDVPELCTFTVPATLRRGDLTIAVSTNGRSPALSREIRLELERLYPRAFAAIVRRLGTVRAAVPAGAGRQRLMKRLAKRAIAAR